MSETNTLENQIAGDVGKAIQLIPVITSTIAAAQSTLSTDQHADVVTKTLDLVKVAGTSADAVASSGVVGNADAQHIQAAVAAVESGTGFASVFASFIAGVKKAFAWL